MTSRNVLLTQKDTFVLAVKPLFYVCRMFGLVPFRHIELLSGQYVDLQFSWIYAVLGFIWIVILVIDVPFIIKSHNELKQSSLTVAFSNSLFVMATIFMSVVSILWAAFIRRNDLRSVILGVSKIIFQIKTAEERMRLYYYIKILVIGELFVITVIFIGLLVAGFVLDQDDITNYAMAITHWSSAVINTLMLLMFNNCALILKHMYKTIHLKLTKLLDGIKVEESVADHMLDGLCYRNIKFAQLSSEAIAIRKLREAHKDIYEILRLVNSVFGASIFLEVPWVILAFLSMFYASLRSLAEGGSLIQSSVWIPLSWSVYLFIHFIVTTYCCHLTITEAEDLAVSIQMYLLNVHLRNCLSEQLEFFLRETQTFKVSFRAAGFYEIHLPFLVGTIGVIISYVLLMIQLA